MMLAVCGQKSFQKKKTAKFGQELSRLVRIINAVTEVYGSSIEVLITEFESSSQKLIRFCRKDVESLKTFEKIV